MKINTSHTGSKHTAETLAAILQDTPFKMKNMKKIIYGLIFLIIFSNCQNRNTSNENTNVEIIESIPNDTLESFKEDYGKVYNSTKLITKNYKWINFPIFLIGYVNHDPVFKSWETSDLYILEDTLRIFKSFSDTIRPVYVDENVTIYTASKTMIIDEETEETTYKISNKLISAAVTDDGRWIYFITGYNEPIQILDMTNMDLVLTDLNAYHLHIYKQYLYYTIKHPEQSGSVIVKRTKLDNLKESEIVINCVFEEGLTFFPSDSLIGVHANLVTDTRTAIYNIKTKKYSFIDGVQSDNLYPMILPRTGQIGLYKIGGFKNYFYNLEFDFKTAKELKIADN